MIRINLTNLKIKEIKQIYLFIGEEEYLIKEYIEEIENLLKNRRKKYSKYIIEVKEEDRITNILENFSTLTLFKEYKLIILKNSEDLNLSLDNLEKLLKKTSKRNILIFCINFVIHSRNLEFYNFIKKNTNNNIEIINNKKLTFGEILYLVKRKIKKIGLKINEITVKKMIQSVDSNLFMLENELKKIQIRFNNIADNYNYKLLHNEFKRILNMLEVHPLTLILNKIYKLYLDKFMTYNNNEEKFNKIANLVFLLKEAEKKNKSYFLKKEEIMKELIYKICQIEKEKSLIV
ncbi:DNA polymerase III subunit delta [Candidatus Karelsulcia muelleri]|uniref:DNA polymerase III subunit delta n=1 Tax=Candidatus Karelsulcia muelleri TaxID=336810 RepID=UPI001FF374BD|nr:hypothetical protein [Candidatus Karelsulcia muelleri]UOQ33027.1 DNA polymerase III subunit delta [Candidatus Karelsulcia muelleri]